MKKRAPRALHGSDGGLHLGVDGAGVVAFKAQLHRGHAGAGHAADPVGIGQHGVQAQLLRAGGKGVGRVGGAQTEICRMAGPEAGIKRPQALALPLPGQRQGVGIAGDKAQLAAGAEGGLVDGVSAVVGGGRGLGGQAVLPGKAGAVRGQDGGLQGGDGCVCSCGVVYVCFMRGCQKGVPRVGVLGWAAVCSAMAPAR